MQPDGYFITFYPACPFRSHFCELSFMKMKIFLSWCCHCKGTQEGALSHPGANECFGSSRHPRGDFHDRDYSTQVRWISVKSMKLGGWSWLAWRSRGRDRAEIDEHALDLASRSRAQSTFGFVYSHRGLADLFMSKPGCFIHLWITPSRKTATKLPSASSIIVLDTWSGLCAFGCLFAYSVGLFMSVFVGGIFWCMWKENLKMFAQYMQINNRCQTLSLW